MIPNGPGDVADLTAAQLEELMPGALRRVEARRGLDPAAIPDPQLVAGRDIFRLALEQYPALFVVPLRTRPGVRRVDLEPDGAISVQFTYTLRVYLMVRGDDEHQADQLRRHYVEAARAVILGGLAIGSAGAAQVSAASYAEDYSTVTPDVSGSLAGAYAEFDVTVLELLAPEEEPAGTADELTITAEQLPPPVHPSQL